MKIADRVRLVLAEALLPDTHMVVRNFALRPSPSWLELRPEEFRRETPGETLVTSKPSDQPCPCEVI